MAVKQGSGKKYGRRSRKPMGKANAAEQDAFAQAKPVGSLFGPEGARYFTCKMSTEYPLIDNAVGITITSARISGHFFPLYHNGLDPAATLVSFSKSASRVIIEQKIPRPLEYVKSELFSDTSVVNFYTYKSDGTPGNVISAEVDDGRAYPNSDIVELKFELSLDGAGIGKDHISEVVLECLPTNPRIGLALMARDSDEVEPRDVLWVWHKTGRVGIEINDKPFPLLRLHSPEFNQAVQNLVARTLGEKPVPPNIRLAIVIASDEPCGYYSHEATIQYTLRWKGSFGQEEKTKLEFDGLCLQERRLSISAPPGIVVTKATIETFENFSGRAAAAPAPPSGVNAGFVSDRGVRFGELAASRQLTAASALYMAGCSVSLVSLADNSALLTELRRDEGGGPGGACLWKGKRDLPQAGRQGWVEILFDDPIAFETGECYWLLLRIENGSAVWLANPGEDSVRLHEITKTGDYGYVSSLPGLRVLATLIPSPSQLAGNDCPLSMNVNGMDCAACPPVQNQQGRMCRNVTSMLNQHVIGAGKPVEFTFASSRKGSVIVYPLTIECTVL